MKAVARWYAARYHVTGSMAIRGCHGYSRCGSRESALNGLLDKVEAD